MLEIESVAEEFHKQKQRYTKMTQAFTFLFLTFNHYQGAKIMHLV